MAKEDSKKFTVIIDAGHGGKDIGATDNGVMEKNINLQVAKQLESLIKKKMKNTEIVMTRNSDKYLTLQERADIANRSQGDLFISIHTNSVDKKNKNRKNIAGSSVYTLGLHKDENNLDVAMRENSVIELESDYQQKYSGFDPQRDESYIIFEMAQKKNLSQSIRFAESVGKELVKSGRKDRGIHQAGFWVLWATSMPSVLVELDFICNPESAKYMASEKGAKELAEAIFKALQQYEENWRKNINGLMTDNLSDTYQDGQEGLLTDNYISERPAGMAIAKTRVHKKETSVIQNVKKSENRKRRSSHSKAISETQNYEASNLSYNVYGGGSVEVINAEKNDPTPSIASIEPVKNKKDKKKAEKKLKEQKKKEEKQNKRRKEESHNGKVNKLITVYKIQILASSDLLSQGNSRFCGLSPISTYKENNLYKYYYGESTNRQELESVLADVRKKIPDAFIVSSQKSVQINK